MGGGGLSLAGYSGVVDVWWQYIEWRIFRVYDSWAGALWVIKKMGWGCRPRAVHMSLDEGEVQARWLWLRACAAVCVCARPVWGLNLVCRAGAARGPAAQAQADCPDAELLQEAVLDHLARDAAAGPAGLGGSSGSVPCSARKLITCNMLKDRWGGLGWGSLAYRLFGWA